VEQDGRSSAFGKATEPSTDPVAWDQHVEPGPPIAGESLAASIAALADPSTRSPKPDTCPFLRTIDEAGAAPPFERSDPANRCVAVGEPTPQSSRQQELVCLTTGHSNCPRYLRGALVAADTLAPVAERRGPSTPIVASALVLIAAASMSVGFLLVRGGFDLPAVAAGASQVAVAPSAHTPSAPSLEPSPIVTGPPTASAPPPTSTPTPTEPPVTQPPSPTPAPLGPTPEPPTPAPAPTSDRYLLLVPCPGAADCWIYTVRSGDNLVSIVNFFGVPYDTVLEMNPDIGDPTEIRAGDAIRMPPPTR
jgi:LysM domain